MIPEPNVDPEQAGEEAGALDPRLVTALKIAYCQPPSLDSVDWAIQQAVIARAARQKPRPRPLAAVLHPRLLAPIAALLVLVLGVGIFLGEKTPTRASAQTILARAQTAGLVPTQVTRFIYQVWSSAGFTGTTQFWVQADASGSPERLAFEGTGPQSSTAPLHLISVYSGFRLLHLGPSSLDGSWLKGQRRLNGVTLEVVQEPDGAVLYFDAASYIERGADWSENGTLWRARLLQYGTVPSSSVPAGSWQGPAAPPPHAAPASRPAPVPVSTIRAQSP